MFYALIFLLALDEVALTHIISRPLIACTLLGGALGNMQAGMSVGAGLEIALLGYEQANPLMTKHLHFLLYSMIGVILSVSLKMNAETAIASGMIAGIAGIALSHAVQSLNMVFLPLARNAAEKADEKKIGLFNLLALLLRGLIYTVVAVLLMNQLTGLESLLSGLEKSAWIMQTVNVFAMLMPCIGIAVLARNLSVKNMPGAFLAGAAFGAIASTVWKSPVVLLAGVMIAFGLGAYDYHAQTENKKQDKPAKGGAAKWW